MTRFQEEIKNIAREKRRQEEGKSKPIVNIEAIHEIEEAMDKLFNLTELGVDAYNEGLNEKGLSIYKLPEELLTLFLNLPGKRMGFCVIGPERFVIFLDERPSQILVLGQKRQPVGVTGQVLAKARQLIKITCLKSESWLVFEDNTGANLNPEDVIKHIIKWVSE